MPRKSGPLIACARRYSQIACVIARMCHSLNERSKDDPRWPDVPKLTCWPRTEGSRRSVKYAEINLGMLTSIEDEAGLPAAGLTRIQSYSDTCLCKTFSSAHERLTPTL